MKVFLHFVVLVVAISCQSEEEVPFELPPKAAAILTGDSTKVWKLAKRYNNGTRMNMGDCFLVHRQHFSKSNTFRTSSEGRSDCGDDLGGNWSFVKDQNGFNYLRVSSDQIPELMNIEENYKLFKIQHLSDTLITLKTSNSSPIIGR
ncbi:MAG: hypothetical protein AAF391_03645 [Bacteroidota bacterium]